MQEATFISSREVPIYKEYLWYKANEETLLKRFYNRFVVIKNGAVIADYATRTEAWDATITQHKLGTFMIHHCLPESEQVMPRVRNHPLIAIRYDP